jgi:transcriptional regulator GlxA family with amidase domain
MKPACWDVFFLLLPDSLILDWAGPAEALRMANNAMQAQGHVPPFRMHFVGPEPVAISSVGAQIGNLAPLPEHFGQAAWIVVLGQTGKRIDLSSESAKKAVRWLSGLQLAVGQLELLTVCAGSVLAAHAGLLRGYKATTHHEHLNELDEIEPLCDVNRNQIFVKDPPVYSSAGVTTGIDLVLHRIAEVCGPAVAARVAQCMVLAQRRGEQDSQLSPFLLGRDHLHPALHRLQDKMTFQPREEWSAAGMAAVANTSVRHLNRLFAEFVGMSPAAYLCRIRLALADAALQSGHGVAQAAEMAGFSSDTQLRRAWHRLGRGGTPSRH